MRQKKIIVVGGGASGMAAAICAAREGASVTILEHKDRLGKKILSTGNGKCNLTNEDMKSSYFRSDHPKIIESVLASFGYDETIRFFEELGVCMKNRQGYIYPASEQASAILDVLLMELRHLKIEVIMNAKATEITKKDKGFTVKTDNQEYQAEHVILATGGRAFSVSGSDGSGYVLAKHLGHRLSPVVPALVQLRCKEDFYKQLAGIRTQGTVTLYVDDTLEASDTGELQLTGYGISGIPVFQVSRFAAKALAMKKEVYAELDFFPSMNEEIFAEFFLQRKVTQGYKTMEEFFVGIFPKKLALVFLKLAGIHHEQMAEELSDRKLLRLARLCKHFRTQVTDTNSFEQAQVCAGGIRTDEIDEKTMESKVVPGLYIAGEIMDVDGICGGYNLQWAWASGCLAGTAAAKG